MIGEVASADSRFASGFVASVVEAASERKGYAAAVAALGDVPAELECMAEHHLVGAAADPLGYVDLRFDREPDFTLFVENKLYSGYGEAQVARYHEALSMLPRERKRKALVAVTRVMPGYGEPDPGEPFWLGSVRWAEILPALRRLRPVNEVVTSQWRLLLDTLESDGDMGLKAVDRKLIEAWPRYLPGRDHLAEILELLWENTRTALRYELKQKYGGPATELADVWRKGKRERVVVVRDQRSVWVGFSVPARAPQPSVIVQFDSTFEKPLFTVQAEPWNAHKRIQTGERQLRQAARRLEDEGFKPDKKRHVYWAHPHEPSFWLHDSDVPNADVPARLSQFIKVDIEAIVRSGILTGEFEAAAKRSVFARLTRKRR